jgi:uncharacterized protein
LTARDPLIEAIARNPRPLVMMMIGLVGMPLSLWLFTPERAPAPPAPVPRVQETPPPARAPALAPTETVGPAGPPETPAASEPAQTIEQPVRQTPDTEDSDPSVPLTQAMPLAPDPAPPAGTPPDDALPVLVLPPTQTRYIAIIIDDIGYVDTLGARAIALPDDVTFAVLPHTPFGAELAESAHRNGKEVMLHAPMSNLANMPLGPGGLTPALSKEEFVKTLSLALEAVPNLKGINNHMGSELTTLESPMRWVMETLQGRDLYFVDSYTNAASVAGHIAREANIPTLTRNVFLDNVQTHEDIDREFQRLLQVAREKGFATGIGHPYEATLEYLEKAIPTLTRMNIELVPVSEMIRLQRSATDAL